MKNSHAAYNLHTLHKLLNKADPAIGFSRCQRARDNLPRILSGKDHNDDKAFVFDSEADALKVASILGIDPAAITSQGMQFDATGVAISYHGYDVNYCIDEEGAKKWAKENFKNSSGSEWPGEVTTKSIPAEMRQTFALPIPRAPQEYQAIHKRALSYLANTTLNEPLAAAKLYKMCELANHDLYEGAIGQRNGEVSLIMTTWEGRWEPGAQSLIDLLCTFKCKEGSLKLEIEDSHVNEKTLRLRGDAVYLGAQIDNAVKVLMQQLDLPSLSVTQPCVDNHITERVTAR